MLRDMPMNGAKGRARTLSRIRRERTAEAKAMGIDTTDRKALAAWDVERSKALCGSIREQLRCGCSGIKHQRVTGWEG